MEAKNYRVGNIVKQPSRIGKISEVWQDAVKLEGYNNAYDYNHTDPIHLSDKFLTAFGFVKDNNGNYWIDLQTHYLELMPSNGYWYPTYAQLPEMSHESEQRVSTNRIDFVHELQNLFFALTGKELELKN